MKKILTISFIYILFANVCFAEGSISHKCSQEKQMDLVNESIINYSLEDFVWEPSVYVTNIWDYNSANTNIEPTAIRLNVDDLTWYYENFDGYVNVYFEVVGYGFSNASKIALEEEIREAIQKIIDLHFPKENN